MRITLASTSSSESTKIATPRTGRRLPSPGISGTTATAWRPTDVCSVDVTVRRDCAARPADSATSGSATAPGLDRATGLIWSVAPCLTWKSPTSALDCDDASTVWRSSCLPVAPAPSMSCRTEDSRRASAPSRSSFCATSSSSSRGTT